MLEMIQLIAGSKAFHSAISKAIVAIQEEISPYSLHEISLSNTPWTHKLIYKTKKQEIQVLRCLNSSIIQNTPECFTSSKYMCIYKLNWAWSLDLVLHLQSTL